MFRKILYAALPFLTLFVLLLQIDQSMLEDLGRHLRMGETIAKCLCVPETNLFSYTNPNFPVVNHEWLTQLILFLIYNAFGLRSLLIVKMIIMTIAFSIVYYLASKKSSLFWLTTVSLPLVVIFSSRFRVRPEMFSYLFIAVFLLVLYLYENGKLKILRRMPQNDKLLLLLPLIELLWVNMHIYFILGLLLYTSFLVQEFAQKKKVDKFLLLIGGLLLLSTLFNPQFIKGALLPLTFQTNYGLSVQENMSIFDFGKYAPSFIYTLSLQVLIFEVVVGIFLLTAPLLVRKKAIATNLNGFASALLGLKFVRSMSLFGILGLSPLSEKLTDLEKAALTKTDKYLLNPIKIGIFAITIVTVFIYCKGLSDNHVLQFSYQPYAEDAVNFINTNHLKGPIFNNYHIGNYLIYGLYPREKIFIDARPEMYPASFLKDYERMLIDQEYFDQQVKKYSINLIVFGVQLEDPQTIRPFMLRQIESKQWVPIYADGNVTILIKKSEENKKIIAKLGMKI